MSTDTTQAPAETVEQIDARRAEQIKHYRRIQAYSDDIATLIRLSDTAAGMVLVPAAELERLREVAEAARKAIPIMRALGWHLAAACEHPNTDAMIEALAATETYEELSDALDALAKPEEANHG